MKLFKERLSVLIESRRVRGRALLLLAFLGLMNLCLALPPRLDQGAVKGQYQSYRYAITAAASLEKSGALLAVPLDPAEAGYGSFERMTNDDIGYPLFLTFLVQSHVVTFNPKQVERLKNADYEKSRTLLKDQFVRRTYQAGFIFYYACLFAVLAIAIMRSHFIRSPVLIALSGASLCAVPYWIPALFGQTLHSHTLIPGLCVLALGLPLLHEPPLSQRWAVRLARFAMSAAILSAILLTRKSTGYMAAAAFAGFVLVSLAPLKQKLAAFAIIPAAYLLTAGVYAAVDLQRSLSGVEIAESAEAGSDFGHPIFHALLSGIAKHEGNSLGVSSEIEVIQLVRDKIQSPKLEQDSREYISAARGVYLSYVAAHPGEAIAIYLERLVKTVGSVLGRMVISPLLIVGSWVLVFFAFARRYIFLRRRNGVSASDNLAAFLILFLPLSLYTSILVGPFMVQEFQTLVAVAYSLVVVKLAAHSLDMLNAGPVATNGGPDGRSKI